MNIVFGETPSGPRSGGEQVPEPAAVVAPRPLGQAWAEAEVDAPPSCRAIALKRGDLGELGGEPDWCESDWCESDLCEPDLRQPDLRQPDLRQPELEVKPSALPAERASWGQCQGIAQFQGINWSRLLSIGERDLAFTARLLQVFWEDAQRRLPRMEQAIAAADWLTLRQEAHRLKGASANLGLEAVCLLGERLEQQPDQSTPSSRVLCAQLLNQLQAALQELEQARQYCLSQQSSSLWQ